MRLAADIGNTTISFAVLKKRKVLKIWSFETVLKRESLKTSLRKTLGQIKRRYPSLDDAVICSVVPKALPIVKSLIKEKLSLKVTVMGVDKKVPMKNLYRNPKQVGQDRLVGAFAASRLYGIPVIIIDFGTAITFDVVSKKKEYLGGIIVPGIRLSAESLFSKTAMLPKIRIKTPTTLIGKDTQASMLSGIFFGYGALCGGLVQMISKQIKGSPKVIITGGYAKVMKKFIPKGTYRVDEDLVFKGLGLL